MPNITWQEPQIFVDLLAENYYADFNEIDLAGERKIAFVSPWISNVELAIRPNACHQNLTVGECASSINLSTCIKRFCEREWDVHIAVLKYGKSLSSGLIKKASIFKHEIKFLKNIFNFGAKIYLCPDLHAKGVVTPLGIITGGTNITHSGLYFQSQNSNYFSYNHPDYESNRIQLMAKFTGTNPIKSTEEIM